MGEDPSADWSYDEDLPAGPAPEPLPTPGQWFGPFEILEALGRGGMGAVFRARDADGRLFALKLLRRLDESQLQRFDREGRITASLRHPGIVRIHAAGMIDAKPYLAYELVEGCRTLDQVLPELPLTRRVELVRDVARALGHAHAQGLVHRDVKPQNVLVDAAGRARVADFGLVTGLDLSRLTATGAITGTPRYMSPEQITATRELGPPADVWGLGVILYEALTNTLPFPGETFTELAAQVSAADPTPPRQLEPALPAPLEAVCLVALRTDPRERYPDGAALADDLERALSGEQVRARPPRLSRSTRGTLAALAVILGAVGALALLLRATRPDPPSLPPAPLALESSLDSAQVAPTLDHLLSGQRTPAEQLGGLTDWLRAHPAHPRAPEATSARRTLLRQVPLLVQAKSGWRETKVQFVDERRLLSRESGGRITLWRLTGDDLQPLLRPLHAWSLKGKPKHLVALPDGRTALAYSEGGHVVELDLETGASRPSAFPFPAGNLRALAVSPDGRFLAVAVGPLASVFTYPQGSLKHQPIHPGPVTGLVFSPTRDLLAIGCETTVKNKSQVHLYGVPKFHRVAVHPLAGRVRTLAAGPGGVFAAGTDPGQVSLHRSDGFVRLRAVRSKSEELRLAASFPTSFAMAHDGRLVDCAFGAGGRLFSVSRAFADLKQISPSAELRVWDTKTHRQVREPHVRAERIYSVHASPSGRFLVLGCRGGLEVWGTD